MIYRETPAQVFSCKFWESFDNTFLTLTKHLTYTFLFDPRQNLDLIDLHHQRYSADSFFATQWANRNQFFFYFWAFFYYVFRTRWMSRILQLENYTLTNKRRCPQTLLKLTRKHLYRSLFSNEDT